MSSIDANNIATEESIRQKDAQTITISNSNIQKQTNKQTNINHNIRDKNKVEN